ncbi:nonsense-mediated mRNA decay factor SMG7-like isoform X4 [Macrobrachium rosenbergii]|uniref:nonsense-mediated mRNA decay factor SMG7-like isoform X4 n=1 Tax=Macrobrachium rosenbergii TaxID=79674 RepID=UPI0034D5615D
MWKGNLKWHRRNVKISEAEGIKSRLSNCSQLVGNNEAWAIQHQLQVVCGQLLVHWIEVALDHGVERDLWNLGFRNTITQLQAQAKDKQGGSSEARDLLGWFLNSASGFYLQLFNQICSEYGLDLPFRRKDSIYGAVDLNGSTKDKSKGSSLKNALYLCQYCLVHLGDLARYRHQAKQAETYYRHAVVVAPTSGHPYNQLALLEAGRGNRLAAVALYVRAMCVPCPFPGAPANLTQTLSKLLSTSNSQELGGSTRVTGEEYTHLFLQCHARLYLHGDVNSAREALPTLCSALSTLVATNAFTRTSLIQIVLVNLFALSYFSGSIKVKHVEETGSSGRKDDEKPEKYQDPKECEGCLHVVEELTVGVLAALLLPVHTIRDPDQLMTYPALPAVRLLFEWVRFEGGVFVSAAMKGKQQIWPGLCTLVNNLQQPLASFSPGKYTDVPLTEDWDLQGFEPLQKMLSKYKYREGLSKPSPEEYNLIRASRLTDIAKWFAEQSIDGNCVIKIREGSDNSSSGGIRFEPMQHTSPPVDEVRALEQLSLQPKPQEKQSGKKGKMGILKPQGSLERARETRDQQQDQGEQADKSPLTPEAKDSREQGSGMIIKVVGPVNQLQNPATVQSQPSMGPGPNQSRPRTRTNVALQAIMKRNSAMQEAKQVTFKTPSPAISPNPSEASSDSHRSQLSTPPLHPPSLQRDPMSSSPMPHHLSQMFPITPSQDQVSPYPRQNQGDEGHFNTQQYKTQPPPPPWNLGTGLAGNIPSQHGMGMPQHQANPNISSGPTFNMQRNGMGQSPQDVSRQLQSTTVNQSDRLTGGVFNRPPLEGFHQRSGPLPMRPGTDLSNRIREPAPRMLEMMGMTRAPPSFGPVEGLANPNRMRPPPGTEGQGFDSSQHMNQGSYRLQQEADSNTSQNKMGQATHPLLSPGAMNSHVFGMENRQNLNTSGPRVTSPRNVFEGEVGPPRGPGMSPAVNMGWAPNQEGKSYHMTHPPPTLANLLQQHAPVDMRLNMSVDPATDVLKSTLARLPSGAPMHNPPPLNPRSASGVGPHPALHLGMLSRPSSQPPPSIPLNQPPRGQPPPFLPEGSESDGPASNTYSLFSPMSGSNMGLGAGPSHTVPHPLYPSNSQPSGQQSLWSGPGPSPLERLLEQKKYSSVPK